MFDHDQERDYQEETWQRDEYERTQAEESAHFKELARQEVIDAACGYIRDVASMDWRGREAAFDRLCAAVYEWASYQ